MHSEIKSLEDLLPGILKTTTLGYDGKGQYPMNTPLKSLTH